MRRNHHEAIQAAAQIGFGEIVGALGLLVPLALRPIGEKWKQITGRKPAERKDDTV